MLNMNPLDIAKQRANATSGGSLNFFHLKDGESTTLRFLTGLKPSYILRHSCGASVDITAELVESNRSAGVQTVCPSCGAPLTEADLSVVRPCIEVVDEHRFIKGADGKFHNYVCIGSELNEQAGLIDKVYQCPVCAMTNSKGKPEYPSSRIYGLAVTREPKTEQKNINGVPVQSCTGVEDKMVDGTPEFVIINESYKLFWSILVNALSGFAVDGMDVQSTLCYYDWRVTRIGEKLDTTYTVDCLNSGNPFAMDYSQYAEKMPDLKKFLHSQGTPQHYTECGMMIQGYTPEVKDEEPVPTVAAPFQQQAGGMFQQQGEQVTAFNPNNFMGR